MANFNPVDYIAWVQRSLNRIVRSTLLTNGVDTTVYRKAVHKFNKHFVRKASIPNDVDVKTQDELIRHNEKTNYYVAWVQRQLLVLGHSRVSITGKKDSKTRSAIKAFQRKRKLKADGFVGFHTETRLLNYTLQPPPGDIVKRRRA